MNIDQHENSVYQAQPDKIHVSIDINDNTCDDEYKEIQVQDMSSIDYRDSKQSRSYIQSKSLLDNFVEFVRQ